MTWHTIFDESMNHHTPTEEKCSGMYGIPYFYPGMHDISYTESGTLRRGADRLDLAEAIKKPLVGDARRGVF
jgi:hypothetical protein